MHKVAPEIKKNIDIPILHIADATGKKLQEENIEKIGLLGTAFTMKQDFYKERINNNFNIEVIIPNELDMNIVHKIIYEELCLGVLKDDSKKEYLRIIDNLVSKGAQGVILGCTEIGMLIKKEDTKVKLFDTTLIHSLEAVKQALS